MGEADGNESVRAPDRVQLDENAAFELIGSCKAPRGLTGCGCAHCAHAEKRKRADSHQSEEPTSHMHAIGGSTQTPHHQIEDFSYVKSVDIWAARPSSASDLGCLVHAGA
jgi:hypothetical protein